MRREKNDWSIGTEKAGRGGRCYRRRRRRVLLSLRQYPRLAR